MLFEEPAPGLSGEKWGRGHKEQMRARMKNFVLETTCSQSYEFDCNKMRILKIIQLPMNLGDAQRE
jgi:hypothetical protein